MYVYVVEKADRFRGHDYWSAYVVYRDALSALERIRTMMNIDNYGESYETFLTTDLRRIETFDEDTSYVKAYGELIGDGGEAQYKYRIEEVELRN